MKNRILRIFSRVASICFVLLLLPSLVAAGSLVEVIAKNKKGVVAIGSIVDDARRKVPEFYGTGFVVGDGTRVVTNYHVYKSVKLGAKRRLVVFSGRGSRAKVHEVRLVRVDPVHDLALLELKVGSLPALKLGLPTFAPEGTEVAFTGFPIGIVLGLYPVTHRGMISSITPIVIPSDSAKRLTAAQIKKIREGPFDVYQLDGTAYPGNSGSPVYDALDGRVLGVINSVYIKGSKESVLEKPSGITYAIPVEYVHRLLRKKR